jgi:hypothetical protein
MSIASLVLGLVGLPLCFLFIPSILAIIFGFVGINQIKNDATQTGRGLAIAGIILGFIMIGFMILAIVVGNTEFTVNR